MYPSMVDPQRVIWSMLIIVGFSRIGYEYIRAYIFQCPRISSVGRKGTENSLQPELSGKVIVRKPECGDRWSNSIRGVINTICTLSFRTKSQ